jgi:hypothetical protein
MAEDVAWLFGTRLVWATTRAIERCMSTSERRWPWCARGGEECEGGKGLPALATTVGSLAGREMADSASYLAKVSLKWLSEVS